MAGRGSAAVGFTGFPVPVVVGAGVATESAGAALGLVLAEAVGAAEGIGAAADAVGTVGAVGAALALGTSTVGVIGASGLGSHPAMANAATESSAAAWEARPTPQKTHEVSVDFTWRWQRGHGTKEAMNRRYGSPRPGRKAHVRILASPATRATPQAARATPKRWRAHSAVSRTAISMGVGKADENRPRNAESSSKKGACHW